MKFRVICLVGFLLAVMSACGGGGGNGGSNNPGPGPGPGPGPTPTPTPTPTNNAPVIALTAGSTATVGTPLTFDASATTDPDGDALAFNWEFGDGGHGGLQQIAHLYAVAGNYTVTLTVTDSRGATATTQRAITVQALATAGPPVNTLAVVRDTAGALLSGVEVTVTGSTATATTGADGRATIATDVGVPTTLVFKRVGYTDQTRTISLPTSAEGGYVEATLRPREPAQTLADAAAGGTLIGMDGAQVMLPANGLITAAGAAVTGPVQVSITPVDVGLDIEAFPGKFAGVKPDGEQGIILSYGTVEFSLSQGGAPVNLAPGKMATIEIPIYTTLNRDGTDVQVGATYPLWSLDERTGMWIQEGTGIVVTSANGLALRGEVAHFSWWNHDSFDGPAYKPKPRCLVDTDHDGNLEDLTGTGFCWHYGTGPEQPNTFGSGLGVSGKNLSVAQRALPKMLSARRLPAVAAYDTTPAAGGKVLEMPHDMDITVISTAHNGTLRGTRVFRGPANLEEDVDVVLYPVGSVGQNEPITLPWDQSYVMSAVGELDGFNFTLAANENVEVRITQSQGSPITGNFVVRGPDNAVIASGTLDAAGTAVSALSTQAGQYRIELTAATGVPGGYRIQVRSLTCDSTANVSLPVDQQYNINGSGLLCFDVALPSNTALSFQVPSYSGGLTGTLKLHNAAGAELGADDFGGTFNPASFQLGVRQAGTYRIRVANAQVGPGTFRLQANAVASESMAVPGSNSWTDITTQNAKRVLITPPTDGLHSLWFHSTTSGFSMFVEPQRTTVGISGTDGAFALRAHADVLPVVSLVRLSGSTAATVTLTTDVPQPLSLNTTLSSSVDATPAAYWFEGTPGQQLSGVLAMANGQLDTAALELRSPSGTILNAAPQLANLPTIDSGIYTAFVRRLSGTGTANFNIRLNELSPPQPLSLSVPLTQQNVSLALGEVKRYSVDLAQAETFGLSISTPDMLQATVIMDGVYNAFVETQNGLTSPKSEWIPARYVRVPGTKTLRIYSQSQTIETASGDATFGVWKPTPQPTALNTLLNDTVALDSFESYAYTAMAGRYLLRVNRTGFACCFYAHLWASSSTINNYNGELFLSSQSEDTVQLTGGDYTLTVERDGGPAAAEDFTYALIDLEPPVPLTLGASATAGVIDVPGERDYFQITAVGGQDYTVSVSADFNGAVHVHKLNPLGNFTDRFNEVTTMVAFTGGVPLSLPITIPAAAPHGDGVYVIEIVGNGATQGAYSVGVTSP